VTGAGSGFGEAIATRFGREGARVVVADVNEENGRRVVSAIAKDGGAARFLRADVSRSADVRAMIDEARSGFGGLDILVNNAGFSHRMMPLWELPEEDYERVFRTEDLAPGEVIVAATGVSNGDLLRGVRFLGDSARTHSLVMCTRCNWVRFVDGIHFFARERREEVRLLS